MLDELIQSLIALLYFYAKHRIFCYYLVVNSLWQRVVDCLNTVSCAVGKKLKQAIVQTGK